MPDGIDPPFGPPAMPREESPPPEETFDSAELGVVRARSM